MSASPKPIGAAPRGARAARPRKISKTAAFTRIVVIIGATLGTLVLAIRFTSTNTCADVVCRLDASHATTGLAVIGPSLPAVKSAQR